MALKAAAMALTGIAIALLVLYGADVAVSMGNADKEGFLPLDDMQRGMGLGGPAIVLPIILILLLHCPWFFLIVSVIHQLTVSQIQRCSNDLIFLEV